MAAVVRFRGGVHLGSGLQKKPSDRHRVLRRFLTKVFDAVRRHVVKKRRAVHAPRSRANQLGVLAHQRLERREVAVDDRVGSELEVVVRLSLALGFLDVLREGRPALVSVRLGDEMLRVGEEKRLRPAPVAHSRLDVRDRTVDAVADERRDFSAERRRERLEPFASPRREPRTESADSAAVTSAFALSCTARDSATAEEEAYPYEAPFKSPPGVRSCGA